MEQNGLPDWMVAIIANARYVFFCFVLFEMHQTIPVKLLDYAHLTLIQWGTNNQNQSNNLITAIILAVL